MDLEIETLMQCLKKKNPLNDIPTLQILERLEKYKSIDLKRINDQELFDLTLETLPCCNVCTNVIPKGTILYRLRKIEGGKVFNSIIDLSYPPSQIVKVRGRFNDKHESILYVSLDELTTFFEVKAKEGEEYALIQYEVANDDGIQVSLIGMGEIPGLEGLNDVGKINQKLIEQFLYTEFTKDVGIGSEYLYRISTMLAKNFLDIPNCEGYLYPSVAFGRLLNIAIRPSAADSKIKIIGVKNIRINHIFDNGEVKGDIISESIGIINNLVLYNK